MAKKRQTTITARKTFRFTARVCVVAVFLLAISLSVPRLLSSDPCLRDWDIACTYAPEYVQLFDKVGTVIALAAFTVLCIAFPSLLALTAWLYMAKSKGRTAA